MEFTFSFLPATVVAAIVLFLLKECVEGFRRYKSEGRTKAALRTLLAFECERNHATVKSLGSIVSTVQDWDAKDPYSIKVSLQFFKDGEIVFHRSNHDDGSSGSCVLRPSYREFMSKQLLVVATLDAALYRALQPALDAVNEMEHVRQSLINHIEDPERTHLNGFTHYALDELDDIYRKLSTLYSECTGKQLQSHRIR
jgi:hypothetical protein